MSTTDDDVAAVFTIAETEGSTGVTEAGGTDTFTVVLNAQPDSDVVLSIISSDTGEATVTSSLTFTSANWDTAQTVTVTGADDDIIDGTALQPPLSRLTTQLQTITLMVFLIRLFLFTTDDDVAGSRLLKLKDQQKLMNLESTDTFTVVLNAQPSSNVVLSISSSDTGEATVTSLLTFTSSNWDTAQTVTVTGVDDDIIDALAKRNLTSVNSSSDHR